MITLSASFRMRLRRWAILGLAGGWLLSVGAFTALADGDGSREERLKAALVFKLFKFVEWPAAAMPESEPVRLCVLGESAVGDALAGVDGKPVRDRLAQFHRIASLAPADVKGCHVLYIAASVREAMGGNGGMPAGLRNFPTLTVSDAPDFARHGGMIGLTRSENRLSFEINLRNAREYGLEPGAPLLEVATVVE
ncbi:MAG: YfiR family protein [Propionivibrio sp.]